MTCRRGGFRLETNYVDCTRARGGSELVAAVMRGGDVEAARPTNAEADRQRADGLNTE